MLLVGLGLNSIFGWSWADPLAGLVIAAVAIREGLEAWRGDNCCSPMAAALHNNHDAQNCICGPGCTDACCTTDRSTKGAP